MSYRILTINPGSTSTKIGSFLGEKEEFSANIAHDAAKLAEFDSITDQLGYRKEVILRELEKAKVDLEKIDAFVGRGGGL
ncbi:MAG: butyrate kinase, partial [Lachnospiraceae bacterium]|nr:butyrate kinase [Lachnospiraceae bacterium]